MALTLHGYRPSVYTRVARLALTEKGVVYDQAEVNPFAPDPPAGYLALHPFNRVPTLVHDGFVLYETGAITRYVDRAFAGPALQPADPRALARMDQIIGIVDAYAYWPLVRQVYVQVVALPRRGQTGDQQEVQSGLAAAAKVTVPVTLILGERDMMTPARSGKALAAALANSRTVVLSGAGHMMMAERPDQLLAALQG